MTAGLILPFGTQHFPLTQPFDGANLNEPRGVLTSDGLGPKSAKLVLAYSPVPGYRRHLHAACDFAMPIGTKLYAMESGIIVLQGRIARFGDGTIDGEVFQIIQIHRDATTQTLILQTHLSKLLRQTGERVRKGITNTALSGNSGRSTGPHDHIQVVTGPATASPAAIMWGTTGTRQNLMRCLEGKDLAGASWLRPNV